MAFIEPMHRNKPNITYFIYLIYGKIMVDGGLLFATFLHDLQYIPKHYLMFM